MSMRQQLPLAPRDPQRPACSEARSVRASIARRGGDPVHIMPTGDISQATCPLLLTHTYAVLRSKQTVERNHHVCANVLESMLHATALLVLSSKQAHDTQMTH